MFSLGVNKPLSRFFRLIDGSAFLVGVGSVWLVLALVGRFHRLYDPSSVTTCMVLGSALAAAALGVFIPHRLAVCLADGILKRSWSSSARRCTPAAGLPGHADRPLHWVVFGGLAFACGVDAVLSVTVGDGAGRVYRILLDGFLLDRVGLSVVEWLLVAGVTAPLFVGIGMTWSCLHHLSSSGGGWQVRPWAGGMAGMGVAVAAAALTSQLGGAARPELLLLLASVPFFGVAIFAVRRSSARALAASPTRNSRRRYPPRVEERWTSLVAGCVVLMFTCVTACAVMSHRAFEILSGAGVHGGKAAVAMWLLGLAAGLVVGGLQSRRRSDSLGSLGLTVTWAGLAMAASTGVLAVCGSWHAEWRYSYPTAWLAAACFAGVPAVVAGKAVIQGVSAVVARAGDPGGAGSALVSGMILAAGSMMVWGVSPLVRAVGTFAGLVAACLVCVGLGGVLVIHDSCSTRRAQAKRVGVVLGVIALVSLALPHVGHGWLMNRPWKRIALEEGAWLTRSIWAVRGDIRRLIEPAARDPLCDTLNLARQAEEPGPLLDWSKIPRSARVVIVGEPPDSMLAEARESVADLQYLKFDHASESPPDRAESAGRYLRRTHHRYDLILMDGGAMPSSLRGGWAGPAMLRQALDRLKPDGVLVLLTPTWDFPRDGLRDCLAGIAASRDVQFTWCSIRVASAPNLVLAFGRGQGWRERWQGWTGRRTREALSLLAGLFGPDPRRWPDHTAPQGLALAQERP